MEGKKVINYKYHTFQDIDAVLEEANESWEKEKSAGESNRYRVAYILGWVKQSYKSLFEAFEEMNKLTHAQLKKQKELWK